MEDVREDQKSQYNKAGASSVTVNVQRRADDLLRKFFA